MDTTRLDGQSEFEGTGGAEAAAERLDPLRLIGWPTPSDVAVVAAGMRRRALAMVLRRRGGYLIQSCSGAEVLATLCLALADSRHHQDSEARAFRRHGSGSFHLNGGGAQDHRLIVSPAHYALALYSALVEIGKLSESDLDRYGAAGSDLELIGADYSPGFEVMGGSLGQGLSQAVGIALGRRWRGDPGRTFVFLSDGEMQEGQTWEAVQCARHHRIAGLSIIVDVNGQQVDGEMATVTDVEPLEARFAGFGVDATTVDGHDVDEITAAFSRIVADGPAVTICRTRPDRGVPFVAELSAERRHGLWFTDDAEYHRLAAAAASMGVGRG